MAGITESELYAEIVAAHRRGLPVQEGDITLAQFAQDIGSTVEVARIELDKEMQAGRLVRVGRISGTNRPIYVYRLAEQNSASGD
jgi:hypothetical protein